MNRRISRLAILVALLVSMIGIYQGGDALTKLVLAEGDSCPDFVGHYESNSPASVGNTGPAENNEFVIDTIYSAPEEANNPNEQTLIQFTLLPDGAIAILPEDGGDAIIRVDDGSLTLWNCGQTDIEVLFSKSSETTIVGPGEDAPILPGEAVYVDSSDIYYLSEGTGESGATPVAGIQPLSNELSTDALPAANHGGSHGSASVVQPYKLCSKSGC